MSFGCQVACAFLAMTCAGCCTFNACIPDLAFTSLTRPAASELQGTNSRWDLWRLQFKPGDLKLRFSTTRDLFHLQERNGGFGSSVSVTLCDDKSGFISFGRVYTDDGWAADALLYNNSYTKHVPTVEDPQLPTTPSLRRAADGRITYEAPIRIESVMHSVRDPRFGSLTGQFTPLPSDLHRLPDLCFSVGGGVFTGSFGSNTVVLPQEAVINVLGRPEPRRDTP